MRDSDDLNNRGQSVLTLFMSIYNVMSFFSETEIAVILALLQLPVVQFRIFEVRYEDNPRNRSRKISSFLFCTCRLILIGFAMGLFYVQI